MDKTIITINDAMLAWTLLGSRDSTTAHTPSSLYRNYSDQIRLCSHGSLWITLWITS